MNDTFYEQLVTRKTSAGNIVARIAIIAALALFLIFSTPLLGLFSIIITAVLAFGAYYFIFQKLNVEYEYTLLNYDMEIDVIYNKSKRQELISFDVRQSEIMAPKNSPRLNSCHPDKTLDFSSKDGTAFALMIPINQKNTCIILEPDSKMLTQMKSWMGTKLYMD
ncbi:MAG: hypothetical protein QM793_09795 [Muricomes sp.]